MSVQGLSIFIKIPKSITCNVQLLVRNFSRRSVNSDGPYKLVKARKSEKEDTVLAWKDPDFELLASRNFPFFMPGNVGPAWYDSHTTLQNEGSFIMEDLGDKANAGIICKVQSCPQVLRKTVCDLFPFRNLEQSDLSVITITLKPDLKRLRKNQEVETEKLAQTFVITAKNVCSKLRKVGYWADFINPFSGRSYFAYTAGDELYNTDEKFRCLDFQIFEIEKCLIVSNEEDRPKKSFIGSLFTNAPSKKDHLQKIFTKK